jgi:coenzyme A diphosphatase NUDT7
MVPFKNIMQNLSQYRHTICECPPRGSRAAVLVPLFSDSLERTRVLVTVRSSQLKSHPGEVAFPGGKCEEGESDVETALREAREEIGLEAHHVRMLTKLEPFLSKFKTIVRPVIGAIDASFRPSADSREISEVFSVPLDIFLSKSCHNYVDWTFEDHPWRIHHFTYQGRMIWGLTALILIHAARIAYQKDAEFQLNPPGSKTHLEVTKELLYGQDGV